MPVPKTLPMALAHRARSLPSQQRASEPAALALVARRLKTAISKALPKLVIRIPTMFIYSRRAYR